MTLTHTGVVAFAFAVPADVPTNNRLKAIAQRLARYEIGDNHPIYTQPDIAIDEGYDVAYIAEKPNTPSPTLRIAREAVKWAKTRGIRHLWVIGAKPHMWRCVRDLRMAIKEAGMDIDLLTPDEIEISEYMSWFEPKSTQPRTQSFKNWWLRDLVLFFMPFFIYKRVAS